MIILETARLLFRDHEPADLEPYCAIQADAEVRRYVGGAPRTRENAERKFHSSHQRSASSRLGLHATVFKPDDRYIGYCGIYPHFAPAGPIDGEAALGFTFARDYWGRGLATEAGRAFVKFGFEELRLRRIVATVQVGNAASVRAIEKLGFQLFETEPGERSFYKFELLMAPNLES